MADAKEFLERIPSFTASDFRAETLTPLDELKELAGKHMRYKMELFVTHLQHKMLTKIQTLEKSKQFLTDRWERPQGGGGITCILQDGENIFILITNAVKKINSLVK